MRKIFLLTALLVFAAGFANAQRKQIDSLNRIIAKAADDSNKVKALFRLADQYLYFKPDSGIKIGQQCYTLAVATKNALYQRRSLILLANMYVQVGNYTKAMQIYYDAVRLAEKENNDYAIIQTYNNIGSTYNQMPDYAKALQYLRMAQQKLAAYKARNKNFAHNFDVINVYILNNLDETFLYIDKLDSAEYYIKAGMEAQEKAHFYDLKSVFIADQGILESKKGNYAAALNYFHEAEQVQLKQKDLTNLDLNYFAIANVYKKLNKPDSAIFYAQSALASAEEGNYLPDEALANKLLYELYDQQKNIPLAYKYYKAATKINDSLISSDKIRELSAMDFEQKQKDQELAAAKQEYQNTVRTYILIGVIAVVLIIAFLFWRNASQRKKANTQLQEQKEEIEATLDQLQQTQTQLIQSEKMASLGELTAGIAHEIQNPLNFVNNFSDVNREMLEELKAESLKPKAERDEQLEISLINDLIENELKISHHGKRADSIVKGMLQHSRASSGQKEPVNINTLADEYLRLAYHGLRAKDKSFNAEMLTHFDENLPKVNVVSQDMGRVLLNLFNNAFYAVNQKAKTAGPDYKPEVTVSTSSANGQVVIQVKDNGNGIPEAIKDKIMQPFFTTKPTGEGTGLGLSLSYDIVVKGHGGSMQVESKEGEGSEFMIKLPVVG
jgi:signal transduction histidine kinase